MVGPQVGRRLAAQTANVRPGGTGGVLQPPHVGVPDAPTPAVVPPPTRVVRVAVFRQGRPGRPSPILDTRPCPALGLAPAPGLGPTLAPTRATPTRTGLPRPPVPRRLAPVGRQRRPKEGTAPRPCPGRPDVAVRVAVEPLAAPPFRLVVGRGHVFHAAPPPAGTVTARPVGRVSAPGAPVTGGVGPAP